MENLPMKMTYLIPLMLISAALLWSKGTADSTEAQKNQLETKKGGLINAQKAKELMEKDSSVVLIDVRTKEEYVSGKIPGALLLPYDTITEQTAGHIIPSKNSPIIVYCRSGRRSAIAAQTLRSLGYTTVYDLGGISSWPFGLE